MTGIFNNASFSRKTPPLRLAAPTIPLMERLFQCCLSCGNIFSFELP